MTSKMSKEISIIKRSGKKEKFSADKINKILQWACADIKGVSFEQVAMNAHLQFFEGTTPAPAPRDVSGTKGAESVASPLAGVDPNDSGVDITNLLRMTGGWRQIK